MKRVLGIALPMIAAVALLGACGTSEKKEAAAGSGSGPVTVTDNRGKAVTLKAPATKVVSLEWGEAEMLVTLGVQPVGVADVKGYGTWVTAAKLDSKVKDVGTRAEPSVDSIVALQPDLVIVETEKDSPLVTQLEKFVPVLVLKGSDASRNLARMKDDLNLIATLVGKQAEAKKVLADFDESLAAAKKKIADKGAAGRQFVIADGYKEGSTISIRMFGPGALVSDLATGIGLKNAWTGKVDAAWGLGQTDVEGLSVLKDNAELHFFYNASDGDDVFTQGLAGNPLWDGLGFVKAKQVHKVPDGIWTFGGPASGKQYVEQLLKVYAP